jgi:altronate dehydratase
MTSNTLIIHPADNVAIALEDIPCGGEVRLPDGRSFSAQADIPFGHKVLLADLAEGGDVIKYGEVISRVKTGLKRGEWVHTHNLLLEEV